MATTIEWRVESPFRLFLDPAVAARHRAALDALTAQERRQPVLAVERLLADRAPRGWAEAVYTATCWSPAQQRYRCDAHPDYAHPRAHRIVATLSAPSPAADCTWTVATPDGAAVPMAARTAPCALPQVFDVPYPGGAHLTVRAGGTVAGSAAVRVSDLLVVGIGDSFASGDGNPDAPVRLQDERALTYRGPGSEQLDGYPARLGEWASSKDAEFRRHAPGWLSTPCHRSLYGHHARAALQLALEDPHRAVTFASFACWGADIIDGLLLPPAAASLVPDLPRHSQLDAAAALQCGLHRPDRKSWPHAFDQGGRLARLADLESLQCPQASARKIDLLLVSIGGNDIGFAQMVANAVLADTSPLRKIGGWLGQVISARQALAALPELDDRFKALNRAARTMLHIPWSESDRIVLTGYPPIALQEDGTHVCPSGPSGMTVMPHFVLDQQRARDSEIVASRLHAAMQRIARQHGWTFVDAHRAEFSRHGLCAGAIGALASPADDGRLPRRRDGAWHPYPPSQWQPYAPRRRWIRTPNDGFLTVNFHAASLELTALNLLMASSYSGAFHPTAEGQAAMADALADKARVVLRKYAAARPR